MSRLFVGSLIAWIALFSIHSAGAQTVPARPVRRVEAAAGGGLLGGVNLGSGSANLRANDTTVRPYQLFKVANRLAAAPLLEARAGVALSRRWGVEGVFVFSHPELRSAVGDDVESAAPRTVVERIDQYFVEGSLIFMFEELSLGSRTVPFVAGGVGYLRQLHEGKTVIEEGHLYHLGGGIKHWMLVRERGVIRAAGLRADARAYFVANGIAVESRTRTQAAISGGFFVSF